MNVTYPVEFDDQTNVVEPLDPDRESAVTVRTADLIREACAQFALAPQIVPVRFDLRGRCAGMFRVKKGRAEIRFNPWIFARYFEDNLASTVPHEVAHYVVYRLFPNRRVKPHGIEWRNVMYALGAEPTVTCNYDLSGLPRRQLKRFTYQCRCRTHELTSIRHNRITAGRSRYHCQVCREPLVHVDSPKK